MEDREEIARAIQSADESFGYKISLTRLVDGVATYTLTIGDTAFECASHDECHELISFERNRLRADAILARPDPVRSVLLEALKGAADHLEGVLDRGNGSDLTVVILKEARAAISLANGEG